MKRLVALDIAGGPAFRAALERAWADGDAVLPLDRRLPRETADRMMHQLGAGLVATEDERVPTSYGLPMDEGDALVVATSGTGGEPRGVVLTHDAVRSAALATSKRLGVDRDRDRWLACLPLSHVGGLGVVTRAIHTGTPLEIHDGFEPDAVTLAADNGATLVSLVETALNRIDATHFRKILLGGSAVRREHGHNVVVTYGMTESGGGIVYNGVALDDVEVRIERGEIVVRGPMLLRCYRNGEDPKDSEGWYATGDLGHFEGDRLVVDGRAREVIVTGGESVVPGPVEDVLSRVAGVVEVAVVGRPDPEWGEAVTAVVVPADVEAPPALEALREAVREVFPAYAAPRRIEIVDHLPRTSLGKIRRADL